MGNVGGGEIIVILLVALLVLGPNKLPEAARQIGRVMGELRKVTTGFQRELQDALKDTDTPSPAPRSTPASTALSTPVDEPSAQAGANGAAPATLQDAVAQIPPAPALAGEDLSPAPGIDR
jgi:Tat protein translocase TatB subunit